MLNVTFNADHSWIAEELIIVNNTLYINRVDRWVKAPIPENISVFIILSDDRYTVKVRDINGNLYTMRKDEYKLIVTELSGDQSIYRFSELENASDDVQWLFDTMKQPYDNTVTHECVTVHDGTLYIKINSEWYCVPYIHKFKSFVLSENGIIATTPNGLRQRLGFNSNSMKWVVFSSDLSDEPTDNEFSYGQFIESSLNYSRFNKKAKAMTSFLNSDLELRKVNINFRGDNDGKRDS